MKKTALLAIIVASMLFSACNGGSHKLPVDSTKPLTDENRIVCQLDMDDFSQEDLFAAASKQLRRLDSLGVDILWLKSGCGHESLSESVTRDIRVFTDVAHQSGKQVWLDWVFCEGEDLDDAQQLDSINAVLKNLVSETGIDGFCFNNIPNQAYSMQSWHDIIRELKVQNRDMKFLFGADIANPANQRATPCGFDYDLACDFQNDLALRIGSFQTQADTLRVVCEHLLEASETVQNRRIASLVSHDHGRKDVGSSLTALYGDNRYILTVLEFTFFGMPLLCQCQDLSDPKMLNTVRTLIALHHQQAALASDAPVRFLPTSDPNVLAFERGPVVVVLNLGPAEVKVNLSTAESGSYEQWLNSATIAEGPVRTRVSLDSNSPVSIESKGYAVYVM